ncbi:LTXXQ domain-containing protein [Pseudomonas sp. CDFA 602]|uniref:Spy/CpxP family protein refolding chaperone n=1 Tax=Pseudomonas californiensis TaxID=2829823 RepID=UPI001E552842|nr:Spy/CpxP family protein refolding chaperone [Pseudomonas californiensis]MCD5996772.1 LTXXQ domain-containing protein [Pseudomonas californiensis]MCD6002370.1 LTXXQ domain-containing protein [Pseudomonas californiensis]
MRKTMIALMFAAALPTVAMAVPQPPAGGPDRDAPGMHIDRDDRGPGPGMHRGPGPGPLGELDLTREQRQQVERLMREQRHERREISQRYLDKLPAADQKAMRDEIDAKRTKTDSDIRALLKPDQQKQFDEIKKEQDQRRAEWAEFKAWKAEKAAKAQ